MSKERRCCSDVSLHTFGQGAEPEWKWATDNSSEGEFHKEVRQGLFRATIYWLWRKGNFRLYEDKVGIMQLLKSRIISSVKRKHMMCCRRQEDTIANRATATLEDTVANRTAATGVVAYLK
ncbi:hypothetical protein FRX31_004824 [Thalictrum thalictroides]|uniref:Uncharacterized protein n=1 Tax=Thalictrum thalictroides TaxID=46969 RepID=A0A7J6X7J2_THATH|nr:hypothetical protein FRX31_004824 [Thalictrum thalictroides]